MIAVIILVVLLGLISTAYIFKYFENESNCNEILNLEEKLDEANEKIKIYDNLAFKYFKICFKAKSMIIRNKFCTKEDILKVLIDIDDIKNEPSNSPQKIARLDSSNQKNA